MQVKIPTNYTPSDNESYMNELQLEYFRQKLLLWKSDLINDSSSTLKHLQEEHWNESDITDRASLETDTSLELKTRNRYRKLISKIEAALDRVNNGEYGYCEETGDEIGLKRLEARPVATLSIEAQEKHERKEKTFIDDDE